jgi:hypothetical protein
MIYELRVYEIESGRAPAVHQRFGEVIKPMFEKHNMRVIGFWETVIGVTNRLTYLLQFDDLAHREKAWDAFSNDPIRKDPEFIRARAENEAGGPNYGRIESTILRPTWYSPLQ